MTEGLVVGAPTKTVKAVLRCFDKQHGRREGRSGFRSEIQFNVPVQTNRPCFMTSRVDSQNV